jgi:hypothetical protein
MTWRRLLILDLVLLAALVYGVVRVRQSWMNFESSHRVESVAPEKEPARTLPSLATLSGTVEDWTEVSTKDPFSFDRNDVPIVAPKAPQPTQPKPILFGTMSIGNEWIAMLAPALGANRPSQSVKVGQSVGEWQVVEIRDKSVVVSGENGVRQTIDIGDATAQGRTYEKTGSTGSAAPAVTVVTPTPSASAPVASPTVSATPVSPVPTATPASTEPAKPKILITPFGPIIKSDPQ